MGRRVKAQREPQTPASLWLGTNAWLTQGQWLAASFSKEWSQKRIGDGSFDGLVRISLFGGKTEVKGGTGTVMLGPPLINYTALERNHFGVFPKSLRRIWTEWLLQPKGLPIAPPRQNLFHFFHLQRISGPVLEQTRCRWEPNGSAHLHACWERVSEITWQPEALTMWT